MSDIDHVSCVTLSRMGELVHIGHARHIGYIGHHGINIFIRGKSDN
jgi:hypothetical protein